MSTKGLFKDAIADQNLHIVPVYTFLRDDGDLDPQTPTLHCLVHSTVAPLWEYTGDRNPPTRIPDALQEYSSLVSNRRSAHRDLCDQGLLHRNTSPRSLLLTTNLIASLQSFIIDLELKRVKQSTQSGRQVIPDTGFSLIVLKGNPSPDMLISSPGTGEPPRSTDIKQNTTSNLSSGSSHTVPCEVSRRALDPSAPQDGQDQYAALPSIPFILQT
ncbi:hypothetical protein B0H34DRAFT_796449 [Crassisporium funariophilum]|nr:hypothetical protein B0H34DRAFT_796449 [Crassisporium funariophilum]